MCKGKKDHKERRTAENGEKQYAALYSKLFIACQSRDGDLNQFFSHENQGAPPSLSENGNLRPAKNKSGIIASILDVEHTERNESPAVDAKVLDGLAIVNMLKPNDCKTFADYISSVIQPYIKLHLRLVKPNGSMQNNWSTFLRYDENKTELFPLIVKSLTENINCAHGVFVGTVEDGAVSNQADVDLEPLMPCNIEEADERMFVHVRNAAEECSRILVKTVDSDDVVIALSAFHKIPGLQELWLVFGVRKHLRFIPIHEIANSLGPQTSTAYLFFHLFSGCDTTSSLHGKGKKSFIDTWKKMASATPVFEKMATSPRDISQADRDIIEQFVVIIPYNFLQLIVNTKI
ncbi:Hypothetical predicted protein [Paramuricea clavata]|uniref:Uncharacterized protein n=1 Tax=Paramuricea clavata TaxID=317549 RepID=A0A7D9E5K1_PARCT|nr:Hypothetical predicted protein [Paramuricea clavata]